MLTWIGRTWRRLSRPRLSLRWAMIAVLVVGGVLGRIVARARNQAEVVAAVTQSGGHVRYDWQPNLPRSKGQVVPDRPIAGWLVRNVGIDYFSDVTAVQFTGPKDKQPPIDEAFAAKLGRLHRLEILEFHPRSSIDDVALAQLSGLTALEELKLECSGWTGAGLVHLARMRELRTLSLKSTPVRDEHLAPLSGLTKLRELWLMGDRLSDLGMAHLAPLTDLRWLSIDDTDPRIVKGVRPATPSNPEGLGEVPGDKLVITSRGLQSLSSMKNLHMLQLSSSRIEDLGPIRGLTALDHLHLNDSAITDEGLAPIAGLTKLNHLGLGSPNLGAAGMAHLTGLPNLQFLFLGTTDVDDDGLAVIGRIKPLAFLGLKGAHVTDAGLAGLKNLSSLSLGGKRVTGAGFRSLAGAKLSNVDLTESGVTDDGLAGIAQLSGLDHLTLWRTGITVDGLAHLAAMPKLRHLSVDGTGLGDADLPRLKLPPAIRIFGVWQTRLSPAGIATLRARYPGVEIRNR